MLSPVAWICVTVELFEHVKYENTIYANPSHSMSGHVDSETFRHKERDCGAQHGSD